MKNLINFKKFSINESNPQQSLSQENLNALKNHLSDNILDKILNNLNEESLEVIRLKLPFMYDMLLDRASSRGITIEKIIRANKVSKYI